jgi:G3E family GTPase
MNLGKLERWLSLLMREKGTQLFRYKGVLAVKGYDTKWIFQVSGSATHTHTYCMHDNRRGTAAS